MVKTKIGFAITTYDKFEEAKILLNIIKCFHEDYPVAFCSNHPDGKQFAENNNIKYYIQGEDIPYKPNRMSIRHYHNKSITHRAIDSVQKSCKKALEMDCDYIIHTHSDGWPLNEHRLQHMAEYLLRHDKLLAIRGAGKQFTSGRDTPFGHIDDHFFMFDAKKAKELNLFDFNPTEFRLDKWSVHSVWATIFLSRLGLDNIWYYGDTKRMLDHKGNPLGRRGVKPSIYDQVFQTIHVHRASFQGDGGRVLQAHYLSKAGLDCTKYLQNYISKYNIYYPVKIIYSLQEIKNYVKRIFGL